MIRKVAIISLVSALLSTNLFAKEAIVYSIRVQRHMGQRSGGIVVQCEKTTPVQCFLEKRDGQSGMWTGKVETQPVENFIKQFFSRIPAGEVGNTESNIDVLSEAPPDAILRWEVVASGKRNWGWVTAQEFQGNLLKQGVLEKLLQLETSLAGLSR